MTTSLLPSPGMLQQLNGHFVYLLPAEESDRESIRPLAKDERIWEFTKTLMINDTYDEQFDAYFNEALGLGMTGTGQAFVIREKDALGGGLTGGASGAVGASTAAGDRIIGMTRLFAIDWSARRLEIGHTWYLPSVWGKVYNKECKLLLLQYLFESLHFNRVEFRVAHQNVRSQRAVQKIGGEWEGVLRKFVKRNDGTWRNTVIFSIISDEWPVKKKALMAMIDRL